MVQFLSIHFFPWISSIFVGFFKSSRFLCHSVLLRLYVYIFALITLHENHFHLAPYYFASSTVSLASLNLPYFSCTHFLNDDLLMNVSLHL